MSFLREFYQQKKIGETLSTAERAAEKTRSLHALKDEERKDLEKLTLATQSMWELLRDSLGFTDDHLRAQILEIDARDGKLDRQIGAQPVICPQCQRKAASSKSSCIYCGCELPSPHVIKASHSPTNHQASPS